MSRFHKSVRAHHPYLTIEEGHRRIESSGFFPRYTEGSWDFLPEDIRVTIREKLREEFFGDVTREPRGFFIYGAIGVGKSMLLGLIALSVIRQFAANIRFVSSGMLEEMFYRAIDDKIKKQQIQELKDCDVLFIDDLGAEYGSAFSMTGFTNIIEFRYAQYKPTFITSNYSVVELSEIDGYARIASRLNQENWMQHLSYLGADKRVRGGQAHSE